MDTIKSSPRWRVGLVRLPTTDIPLESAGTARGLLSHVSSIRMEGTLSVIASHVALTRGIKGRKMREKIAFKEG